jgi:sec-independent protein translocase protein TatC
VLTPPDVVSQCLLALPIWFLFELGLLLAPLLVSHTPEEIDERERREIHDEKLDQ